jgi:hypothetical protein
MSIDGFEEWTVLTEDDLKVVPAVASSLRARIGKSNAITARELAQKFNLGPGGKGQARVRAILHHIRVRGIVPKVVASSCGYYVAGSREEVVTYVGSLRQRIAAIGAVAAALQDQLISQGQPMLFDLPMGGLSERERIQMIREGT